MSKTILSLLLFLYLFLSSALSYRTFYLDEPSLCSPIKYKKTIDLSKTSSPAVIIRLTRYKAPNPLFQRCHLEFDAPKGYGVIAVIEEAKLRITALGSCHDHVQFGRDDDGKRSEQICGSWNFLAPTVMATVSEQQKNLIENITGPQVFLQENGRNTTMFYDPGGELELSFYRGLMATGPDSSAIKIVISIYKKGCRTMDQNFFKCPGSFDPSICIPRELQCDGHVNCGNWTQHDETSCMVEANKIPGPPLSASHIIIGMAVVFVLLLFTGVVFWCCCCRTTRRRQTIREPARSNGPTHINTYVSAPLNLPNDPPPGIEMCNVSMLNGNKDAPPSYDELFPEASQGNSASAVKL